ncbi:DUF4214 domain-containing protein [Telluria aromaticivorans]|uniref:DUF4214 domain-containing protein n=1 Tax=Telluria aromaticivorans TaxID=2725995 RepID=A0A7Y2JVC4_9BURK|nr:DUF4214 domain-containing protein [Telluria aromaticivorans]NNG21722.1 DUF4214 domain-containing protein [Telluria aromaticivorans]
MRTFIRLAILAVSVVLASCGGEQQQAQGTGSMQAVRGAAGIDATHEKLVQQLYIGFFGRPADPAGMAYYGQVFRTANAPSTIPELDKAYRTNETVRRLLDSFADSAESRQLYPYCDWIGCDFTWVYAVYRGLLSRDPDIAGAEFWAHALNQKGATRAGVLLSVLAGARGTDAELIERKTRIAIGFTRGIDAAGQSGAYSGHLANAVVRAMLHNVPALADDAAVQGHIDQEVGRLAALASGAVDEVAPGTRKLLLLASAERMADSGSRLVALANAMQEDLSRLRTNGPAWSVTVLQAAGSIRAIREQLRGNDGAILVGQLPIPSSGEAPFLDLYRMPDCPAFQMNDAGVVLNGLALRSIEPRCRNGLVVSILRGTTALAEPAEVANKLDQMIAYHRASSAANAKWTRHFRFYQAAWFGGPGWQWGDLSRLWSGVSLYPADAISYVNKGSSTERRDQFLDCLRQNNEICAASVHGDPRYLQFEGTGKIGEFYSDDATNWYASELAPQFVKAKYVEMVSCSSHNFFHEQSVGTTLLMRGEALLTRGPTAVVLVASTYEEDIIKNEYAMLQTGSTFAEALYGRMEGTPDSIQGDPYITMRQAPVGAQPRLLIDGKHYNGGALTVPVVMPDAVGGASARRVITFSNRGDADLHVRIGSMFALTGVDDLSGQGPAWEYGFNAQYESELTQVFSDGRVLAWPEAIVEPNGGAMPVTLKPGQSVAITYKLSVRTGPDGKPKLPGLYTGQLTVTSDDPGSARIHLEMQGRVR